MSFNPRAREGRDFAVDVKRHRGLSFQSTRPRGARPFAFGVPVLGNQFQSTRPRGARRRPSARSLIAPHVSIHAPARGATWQSRSKPRMAAVSIHAPARGATVQCLPSLRILLFQSTRPRGARQPIFAAGLCVWPGFNPRAREGRDNPAALRDRIGQVSIHAPARGATRASHPKASARRCFNPRAREGRDHKQPHGYAVPLKFQSTRPRGARRKQSAQSQTPPLFQSTRPRGARRPRLRA